MFILEIIVTLVIAAWSDTEEGNCGHSGAKQEPVGGDRNGPYMAVLWRRIRPLKHIFYSVCWFAKMMMRFFSWHWMCWRTKPILCIYKITGRRLRSIIPLSQITQLTSLSPLFTSAQKCIPPVVQNLKSTIGSVWPKPASVSIIEEYGTPAFLSLIHSSTVPYIHSNDSLWCWNMGFGPSSGR